VRIGWAAIVVGLALGGCAGPPLVLYTLGVPGQAGTPPSLRPGAPVVMVGRIGVPDALDSQDILVRDGAILRRSSTGRWASRLSVAATDLVTTRLAARLPGALVTDQPQAAAVSYRVDVNVSRLDISRDGVGVLDANWTVVPGDPAQRVVRNRTEVRAQGSAASDAGVAALTSELFGKFGDTFDVGVIR